MIFSRTVKIVKVIALIMAVYAVPSMAANFCQPVSVAKKVENADTVFVGKLQDIQNLGAKDRVGFGSNVKLLTFDIEAPYKGAKHGKAQLLTEDYFRHYFAVGTRYVIYGKRIKGSKAMYILDCPAPVPYRFARDEISKIEVEVEKARYGYRKIVPVAPKVVRSPNVRVIKQKPFIKKVVRQPITLPKAKSDVKYYRRPDGVMVKVENGKIYIAKPKSAVKTLKIDPLKDKSTDEDFASKIEKISSNKESAKPVEPLTKSIDDVVVIDETQSDVVEEPAMAEVKEVEEEVPPTDSVIKVFDKPAPVTKDNKPADVHALPEPQMVEEPTKPQNDLADIDSEFDDFNDVPDVFSNEEPADMVMPMDNFPADIKADKVVNPIVEPVADDVQKAVDNIAEPMLPPIPGGELDLPELEGLPELP